MGIRIDFTSSVKMVEQTTVAIILTGEIISIPGSLIIISGQYLFIYNGNILKEGVTNDYTIFDSATGKIKATFDIPADSNLKHLIFK